jgi:hypothetical protein
VAATLRQIAQSLGVARCGGETLQVPPLTASVTGEYTVVGTIQSVSGFSEETAGEQLAP